MDHLLSDRMGLLEVGGVQGLITGLDHGHPGLPFADEAIQKGQSSGVPGSDDALNPLELQVVLEQIPGQFEGEFDTLDQALLFQLAQLA